MINNSFNTFQPNLKAQHPIAEWIACALLGFSASSLAVKINILLVGKNLIEPYVLLALFFLFFSNRVLFAYFKRALMSQFAIVSVFLLCTMALLGFLTGGSYAMSTVSAISSIYSEFRSIFIFLFFIALSMNKALPIHILDRLAIKIFVSLTFIDLMSVTVFNNLQYDYFADVDRSSVICIAPLFLMGRALLAEKVIPALACMGIIVAFTIISLMRMNYIYVLLAVMMILYFSLRYLGSLRTSYKTFILIAVSVLLGMAAVPMAMEYFNSNPTRLIHGLYRMQELFGLRESAYGLGETARMGANKVVILEMGKFIVPQGLGALNHVPRVMSMFRDSHGVLSTIDSSFLYCVYHFGLFLGFFVIGAIFYTCIKYCFKMLFMQDKRMLFTSAVYIVSFCGIFSLKSWTFMYWSIALQYAILVPWMLRYEDFYGFYRMIYDNRR